MRARLCCLLTNSARSLAWFSSNSCCFLEASRTLFVSYLILSLLGFEREKSKEEEVGGEGRENMEDWRGDGILFSSTDLQGGSLGNSELGLFLALLDLLFLLREELVGPLARSLLLLLLLPLCCLHFLHVSFRVNSSYSFTISSRSGTLLFFLRKREKKKRMKKKKGGKENKDTEPIPPAFSCCSPHRPTVGRRRWSAGHAGPFVSVSRGLALSSFSPLQFSCPLLLRSPCSYYFKC